MSYSVGEVWFVIIALGVGTYFIRFSFLGLLGDRELPEWVLRHLRYTPVAIIPGLVAPLIVWPAATGGEPDPARLIAATVTIAAGYYTRSLLKAVLCGGAALYLALYLL